MRCPKYQVRWKKASYRTNVWNDPICITIQKITHEQEVFRRPHEKFTSGYYRQSAALGLRNDEEAFTFTLYLSTQTEF